MMKLTRVFPLLALTVGVVLLALPAEGQITSGSATGIERPGKASVTTLGRLFASGASAFPCRATATVRAVIQDTRFSDVFPANLGDINLLLDQGGETCIYVDTPTEPHVRLLLGDVTNSIVPFRREYREGSYRTAISNLPTVPFGCPPGPVTLLTSFVLGGPPPIGVIDSAVWRCFGSLHEPTNYLRTP
jgi:hypothetical protein